MENLLHFIFSPFEREGEERKTRKVRNIFYKKKGPSMIHSARPTVPPLAITSLAWKLFCFERFWKVDGRTDNTCENNDHYWPWLWVGRVDQFFYKKRGLFRKRKGCYCQKRKSFSSPRNFFCEKKHLCSVPHTWRRRKATTERLWNVHVFNLNVWSCRIIEVMAHLIAELLRLYRVSEKIFDLIE